MNRMQPYATQVAVRDGRILSVGEEEQMRAFNISEIDNTFADKVLMPGLVEGHSHLYEGVAWLFVYIGYFDRRDPDGVLLPGLKSKEAIINRLIEAEQTMEGDEPLIAWGFDPLYFGADCVTTATDLVNELQPEAVQQLSNLTAQNDYPVRIVAAASGRTFSRDTQACVENIKNVSADAHDKLHIGMVKLVIDGSIQGFSAPAYKCISTPLGTKPPK